MAENGANPPEGSQRVPTLDSGEQAKITTNVPVRLPAQPEPTREDTSTTPSPFGGGLGWAALVDQGDLWATSVLVALDQVEVPAYANKLPRDQPFEFMLKVCKDGTIDTVFAKQSSGNSEIDAAVKKELQFLKLPKPPPAISNLMPSRCEVLNHRFSWGEPDDDDPSRNADASDLVPPESPEDAWSSSFLVALRAMKVPAYASKLPQDKAYEFMLKVCGDGQVDSVLSKQSSGNTELDGAIKKELEFLKLPPASREMLQAMNGNCVLLKRRFFWDHGKVD